MQDQDRVGQQLGSYRLKQLLGKGGFAKVYLGEHIHTQWSMAIKVLNDITNPGDQQSFLGEAKVIRKLKHPHIIRVTDFGIIDTSVPYIVMDYAPNGTLQDLHPRHSVVSLPLIKAHVDNVADALQYAHDQAIVHCDVKPANMLIDSTNDILLSDFGIAVTGQASRNPATIKNSAIIQGTIAYIAPERLEHGITLPACDQYALGIIVYEWLAGERPFDGTENQIMLKHLREAPPPLYGVYNHVTQEIEQVVMKALAKDPAQRFASIKEFSLALAQAIQASSSISSKSTQPQQQVPPSTPASAGRSAQPQYQATPASPGGSAQPQQQIPLSNPGLQGNPQPPSFTPGYQGNQAQQQQAAFSNQGTQPPFPAPGQGRGHISFGGNPGHANTTTHVVGSGGPHNTAQQSANQSTLRGQLINEWNTFTRSYGRWFELSGEFAALRKNRPFRDAGLLLNILSAVLLGILHQSPGEAFVALFFSLGLFFLCVRLVNEISSVVCGLLIALYWGYVGAVLGGSFSAVFPRLGSYAPATLLGLGFLSVSAYLHIRYVQHRLA